MTLMWNLSVCLFETLRPFLAARIDPPVPVERVAWDLSTLPKNFATLWLRASTHQCPLSGRLLSRTPMSPATHSVVSMRPPPRVMSVRTHPGCSSTLLTPCPCRSMDIDLLTAPTDGHKKCTE
jgi:hypothetical protein